MKNGNIVHHSVWDTLFRDNMAFAEYKQMVPLVLILNGILLVISVIYFITSGFYYQLLTGLVVGNVLAFFNFIFIGITASRVLQKSQKKSAMFLSNLSYGSRYIGILLVLGGLLLLNVISVWTAVAPLFFPKIYYTITAFRAKNDDE